MEHCMCIIDLLEICLKKTASDATSKHGVALRLSKTEQRFKQNEWKGEVDHGCSRTFSTMLRCFDRPSHLLL